MIIFMNMLTCFTLSSAYPGTNQCGVRHCCWETQFAWKILKTTRLVLKDLDAQVLSLFFNDYRKHNFDIEYNDNDDYPKINV